MTAVYPDLLGRTVLITGGASGIDAAHTKGFSDAGCRVAFLDIDEAAGTDLATRLAAAGGEVLFLPCDLNDIAALGSAIASVRERFGPVFALVNNAAQDKRQRFSDITPEDFDAMMSVNLRHAVFAAQLVVPHMRELGSDSIVNTSSVAWMRGIEDLQLYSTAKAAAIGLTNSLARELGRDRIRVNAIAPGFVVTERQRALWFDDSAIDGVKQRQCLPDIIEPDDIANAALFLCSDSARMITKHCLVVHAGSL
ncbi:SDR family NAD(P)-dependent oxidoreductase [Bosea sp. NBC_00550]|uniref:SDR family NAD(P)-dependent oxidoreductase n=1 Tax=Bosea sp. NBC_00550 TaxID=2969621 RepID=UPI002231D9C3|nr:SDR family oxidoreductase [Bosea sp. NBC_00550]UZF95799.1 SDR family oxidoreductase [Bosea sp. NBC_00550]